MSVNFGRNRRIREGLDNITRDYLYKVAQAVNGVELPVLHLARSLHDKSYVIGLMDESVPVVIRTEENNVGSITFGANPCLLIDVPLHKPQTLDRMVQHFNSLPEDIDTDDARAWNALALCSRLNIRLPHFDLEHLWPSSGLVEIVASLYFE